jgi:hypothetical protein
MLKMVKNSSSSKNSNNLLLWSSIFLICLALVNISIVFYKSGGITGYANYGTANLSIQSSAAVNFTTNMINWSLGAVWNNESSRATLDSTNGTVYHGNWTAQSNGLVLQNDGNVNVRINLTTSNIASEFIGGTTPLYEIKTNYTPGEPQACAGMLNNTWSNATGATQMGSCWNLTYWESNDSLRIDVRLEIPNDAPAGVKGSTVTAVVTAIA